MLADAQIALGAEMRQVELWLLLGVLALLAPLVFQPSTALAQAFTVSSTLDEPDANPGDGLCLSVPSGACTLRAAIMEANAQGGASTISLPAGTFKLTIPGANEDLEATGDLDVYANLTIIGAGATSYTFTVRRVTSGQGVQVPFTVVDACGSWPTFAGGGPTAF